MPEAARLDPALNPGLKAAMRAALAIGIPPANIQYALDFAKQGYKELRSRRTTRTGIPKRTARSRVRTRTIPFASPTSFSRASTPVRTGTRRAARRPRCQIVPATELWEKIAIAAWQSPIPACNSTRRSTSGTRARATAASMRNPCVPRTPWWLRRTARNSSGTWLAIHSVRWSMAKPSTLIPAAFTPPE